MVNPYKKQVTSLCVVEVLSLCFFIAGIIILTAGKTETCNSGCVARTCPSYNGYSYPCDCGSVCQSKTTEDNAVYRLGLALLIIGIIGSVFGSMFLCVYRRRYYYYRAPGVVQGQMMGYPAGAQGQPILVGQNPYADPAYVDAYNQNPFQQPYQQPNPYQEQPYQQPCQQPSQQPCPQNQYPSKN